MDYEAFKKEILALSGIDLNSYKEKQMKRRIESLIRKHNIDGYSEFVKAIRVNKPLYDEFINFLTINVSEFYRNPAQWEVLEKEILPMLLARNKTLKVWSAACSTGDEPYTLAMVLSKFLPLSSIRILATDIDKEALNKAKNGVYSAKTLENLPKNYIASFFSKNGDLYEIKDEIKRCVDFKAHDLLKDPYPQDCDLIVCRNVLIYFTEEAKSDIYMKFNKALKNEGILFVGSTEQIILSYKFNFKPVRTFFYIKEKSI